jgi:hypothetical protein
MQLKAQTHKVLSGKYSMLTQAVKNFGIIQEYNERKNKKLINNL